MGRAVVFDHDTPPIDDDIGRPPVFQKTDVAVMAHEVKGVLLAARGVIDLVTATMGDDSDQELMDAARRDIDELVRGMGRLQSWAEGNVFAPKPVDLARVVEASVRLIELESGSSRVLVDARTLVMTIADPDWLSVALRNLVRNALQYSPEHEPIDVRLSRMGETAVISVADRGPGLPLGLRGRMFDPLIADAQGRRGLGLYIVGSIVERHGGRIDVESGDGGTVFRLILPITAGGEEPSEF